MKDPGLVTHRLEHPDPMEAGGAREEDDKQFPSRDGAFFLEEANSAPEEDDRLLARNGAISIEKAGGARETDARFSSRDGANTNWRQDGLKDPGLVTHRLEHPDLLEAGGAQQEDNSSHPGRRKHVKPEWRTNSSPPGRTLTHYGGELG